MKRLLLIFLLSFYAGAQTSPNIAGDIRLNNLDYQMVSKIVVTLPSASTSEGRIYRVMDGQNSSDCTTGGGTTMAICISNGTTWFAVSGSSPAFTTATAQTFNATSQFQLNGVQITSDALSDGGTFCFASNANGKACTFNFAPVFGSAGFTVTGTTSGTQVVQGAATIGGTVLWPAVTAGTDRIIAAGLADTLSNKTYNAVAGAAATPSYNFVGATTTGFHLFSTTAVVFDQAGVAQLCLMCSTTTGGTNTGGLNSAASNPIAWSSTGDPTATSDTIFGRGGAAATFAFGSNQVASPTDQTIRSVQSRGGTDSNTAGSNFNIQAGPGTGTASPKSVKVRGDAFGTASGSTQHAIVQRHIFSGSAALTTGAAKTIASIPLATLQNTGGHVIYHMEATDGTNQCSTDGTISYSAENSAGVFVTNVSTIANAATACTATKTLTVTWAITSANPALLQATPTLTGITPTSFRMIYEAFNGGQTDPTYTFDGQ